MRGNLIALAILMAGAWSSAEASEYVGLWRIDEAAPGIAVTFPDNGFDGACVSFSNGSGEAGEVQLESQINRHRFSSLSLMASGKLDPAVVHVQLAVKGKTAWGATDFDFDEVPVALQLAGYEVTIAAKELAATEDEWTVTLCGMEFANPRFGLRFTSDCAGYDFVEGEASLRLVVDEDWLALEREMIGGMGLFGLSSVWPDGDVELTCQTTFPEQLFYSAVAVDDMPVLQPQVGIPANMDFVSGTPGDHALVVKAKGPVVGAAQWRTSLSWLPEEVTEQVESEDLVAGDSSATVDVAAPPEVVADGGETAGSGGSGCQASGGSGGPALAFLLVLLALLRYHAALCRKARLKNREQAFR